MKHVSDKVTGIPKSGIREFFELTMGMDDVISLGVGEPDFVTPWHIREACIYSLEHGYTMYTSNYGLLELREEISDYTRRHYGLDYNPEGEILVTAGVSEGFDLALRAILNPGDEVIIPEPCFVSYSPITTLAGGLPVTIPTGVENDFKLMPEDVQKKVTKKTRAIILSYPNNPTGAVMTKKELEAIADVAVEHDLIVISDEIYDRLTYEGKHTCFATLNGMKDMTIYLNGLSKSHAMTGFRIGYSMASPEITEGMLKIHQYSAMCAPITAQMAGIEALRRGEKALNEMKEEYNRRRLLIVKRLNEIGLTCFTPKGAFYAFPNIESTGLTSEEFSKKLLKEKKVAVVPGTAFGESGKGFVRCAYAASMEDIEEAMVRIEQLSKKFL
ncbi:aminotransferase class I/II-fold pyridoxal phosphate-dependent enzyme [archaeon]|nr:aminotransferase class I/II-fold pyridoxal phosphate-dependent enzyme [archaeon]